MRVSRFASTVMLGSLVGSVAMGGAPATADDAGPASSGGMGSPEAAVEELVASVRTSDPLGLLAVMHPEERVLIDSLYSNATGSAEVGGAVDVDSLLQALRLDVTSEALAVERLSDRVSWVTTTSAQVSASIDAAQLDAAVTADFSELQPIDPYDAVWTPQEDELGVAVVDEGGRWFVSALYTVAELARRDAELPGQPASPPTVGGAATPETAVTALVAAVAAKDLGGAASALTPFEGRLIADYASSMGGELLDELRDYTVTIDPTSIRVIDQSAEWAIVELDRWRFGVLGAGDETVDETGHRIDFTLTVDGLCGTLRSWDDDDAAYEDSKGCAFEDDTPLNVFNVLAAGGWRGPRFVVVNQGGTWSVSLLQTLLQSVAPMTTDVVTLAGLAEFGTVFFDLDTDEFYPAAISFLAAGQPPLGPGTAVVPARGKNSIAIFRVGPGAVVEIDVDVDPAAEECFVAVLDEELDDFVGSFECDQRSQPMSEAATLLVTTSDETAFASIYPLGDVTVTVS